MNREEFLKKSEEESNARKKHRHISIRLTEEDYQMLKKASYVFGLHVSDYVRFLILSAGGEVTGEDRKETAPMIQQLQNMTDRMIFLMEMNQQTLLNVFEILYRRTEGSSVIPEKDREDILRKSLKSLEALKHNSVQQVLGFHRGKNEDPFSEEEYLELLQKLPASE